MLQPGEFAQRLAVFGKERTDLVELVAARDVAGGVAHVELPPGAQAIAEPWFAEDPKKPGVGEDHFLCDCAREAGFDISVDMNLEIGHLGATVIIPVYRDIFAQTAKGRECKADLRGMRLAEAAQRMAVSPPLSE